jgi:hypothetical protein
MADLKPLQTNDARLVARFVLGGIRHLPVVDAENTADAIELAYGLLWQITGKRFDSWKKAAHRAAREALQGAVEPAQRVLAYLDEIEGQGLGGMASFEQARTSARNVVRHIGLSLSYLTEGQIVTGERITCARQALLAIIDKAGQGRGIRAAGEILT